MCRRDLLIATIILTLSTTALAQEGNKPFLSYHIEKQQVADIFDVKFGPEFNPRDLKITEKNHFYASTKYFSQSGPDQASSLAVLRGGAEICTVNVPVNIIVEIFQFEIDTHDILPATSSNPAVCKVSAIYNSHHVEATVHITLPM